MPREPVAHPDVIGYILTVMKSVAFELSV